MKTKILFVTQMGDRAAEGLSYAFDLASSVNGGVSVLLVYLDTISRAFENAMASMAFAEAGEHKSALEMLDAERLPDEGKAIVESIRQKAVGAKVEVSICSTEGGFSEAIKEYVKLNRGIELVLLSPSLSDSTRKPALRRLLDAIKRPIVTLAQQQQAGESESHA